MRFRVFIAGIVVLMVAYVVFWYALAHKTRGNIDEWVAVQRALGHEISYGDLSVGGFPYRLRVTVRDFEARGNEDGLGWSIVTPHAAAVGLLWQRRHIIVFAESVGLFVLPPDTDGMRLQLDDVRSSVILDDHSDPSRISLTASRFTVAAAAIGGPPLKVDEPELHWRAADQAHSFDDAGTDRDLRESLVWQFAVKGDNITHPRIGLTSPIRRNPYGDTIQKMSVVIDLHGRGLDAGEGAAGVAAWRDDGGTVEVRESLIRWGALDVLMNGSVTLDQQFRPLGAFTALVRGYEPVIDHVLGAGYIDATEAAAAREALEGLIAAEGNTDGRLTLPITLQAGRLFVGPLPLANLPPLLDPSAY